jgi:hypothetical protein
MVTALIARAIVHLNFKEPELATSVLFDALVECGFYTTCDRLLAGSKKPAQKEIPHGNRTAV